MNFRPACAMVGGTVQKTQNRTKVIFKFSSNYVEKRKNRGFRLYRAYKIKILVVPSS